MDEVDGWVVAQRRNDSAHVRMRDARGLVVGGGDRVESWLGDRSDVPIGFQGARAHSREDDPNSGAAQLGDERRDHRLDPSVSLRRHGKPRSRIHENG
jgi:hypothetical protein